MTAAVRIAPGRASWSEVLTGRWADRVQELYEKALAVRPAAAAGWTLVQYLLFAEGPRGLIVGSDDWLFTAEEFSGGAAEMDSAGVLRTVAEVRRELESRGVGLMIALVPAKARIYPEKLGRYSLPGSAAGRYDRARRALESLGVPVPDLAGPLSDGSRAAPMFLRTDTHWTPAGARVAAAALAADARDRLDHAGSPRATFVTREGQERTWKGDLLNFLPLGPLGPIADRLSPRPDRVLEPETSADGSQDGDLFGSITVPVVLAGTSYSAGRLWNFEGALKTELEADVVNAAKAGQGPFRPMNDLLEGPTLGDVHADLVIWEIPERYLPLDWGQAGM
jgi:alginate O-acetyltransferase complex protein AlgJ